MSRDVNQVIQIGRLTRDVETRTLPDGTLIASFSIANNQSYGQKEHVNFFDITVFGKQAESCAKYLTKGKQVSIAGSLRQERWQDKTNGQARSKISITANQVQFLGSSNKASGQAQGLNNQEYQQTNTQKVENTFTDNPWPADQNISF